MTFGKNKIFIIFEIKEDFHYSENEIAFGKQMAFGNQMGFSLFLK